jgi:hypothetical protein
VLRLFQKVPVLHRDRALHRVHGAGEIGDETVAGRVEDPTAVRGDQTIGDYRVCSEGAQGANLVLPMRRL